MGRYCCTKCELKENVLTCLALALARVFATAPAMVALMCDDLELANLLVGGNKSDHIERTLISGKPLDEDRVLQSDANYRF